MGEKLLIICMFISAVALVSLINRMLCRERELGRFQGRRLTWWGFLLTDFQRFVTFRIHQRYTFREESKQEHNHELITAGLTSYSQRERFYLCRDLLGFGASVGSLVAAITLPILFTGVITTFLVVIGVFGPRWWLFSRSRMRETAISRELAFISEALHFATACGSESVRTLDLIIDSYEHGCRAHPLHQELRLAQWYARTGSSWDEGLATIEQRLNGQEPKHTVAELRKALAAERAESSPLSPPFLSPVLSPVLSPFLSPFLSLAFDAHQHYLHYLEEKSSKLPARALVAFGFLVGGFVLLLSAPS